MTLNEVVKVCNTYCIQMLIALWLCRMNVFHTPGLTEECEQQGNSKRVCVCVDACDV